MATTESVTTKIFQQSEGLLELRTAITTEQIINAGMLTAVKNQILDKFVEAFLEKHLETFVEHLDVKALATEVFKHVDFRNVADQIAVKVVERYFAEHCQAIMERVNMGAVANMTAAYTARLAADTLSVLPRGQNG